MSSLYSEIENVYKILMPSPAQSIPVVFNSPHSGTVYPENYGYSSELAMLRRTEDLFIDDLYADVTKLGAPLLACQFARSYIDVNRAEDDIDPDLLDADWPEKFEPTIRSAAGHGLVHRLIRAGSPIYNRRLRIDEIRSRIETYYRPYHHALKTILDDTHYNYGQVWHIDCHSMNSPSGGIGSAFLSGEADFVLGDRDGTTCDPRFTRAIKNFLGDLGYKVNINNPYKGVELLKRYSNPQMGRHGLQIEINKSLYLNEATQEKNKNYNKLKSNLYEMSKFIADWAGKQNIAQAAD